MNEDSQTVEHSDRARYVTEQVRLWISNDGDHYERARGALRRGGADFLREYVLLVLRYRVQPTGSAAWHVAQEFAPNDYGRIYWDEVAAELMTD